MQVQGAKVPAVPTNLCGSRTYRAVAVFGPFPPNACGKDRFTSYSRFQPLGGFFVQRSNTIGLDVFVTDCPSSTFEVPVNVQAVTLPQPVAVAGK